MEVFRYCMLTANIECGIRDHPSINMENLGYKIFNAESINFADCWIFKVANHIDNIPKYLTKINSDYKFSLTDEEWSKLYEKIL